MITHQANEIMLVNIMGSMPWAACALNHWCAFSLKQLTLILRFQCMMVYQPNLTPSTQKPFVSPLEIWAASLSPCPGLTVHLPAVPAAGMRLQQHTSAHPGALCVCWPLCLTWCLHFMCDLSSSDGLLPLLAPSLGASSTDALFSNTNDFWHCFLHIYIFYLGNKVNVSLSVQQKYHFCSCYTHGDGR